MNQGTFDQVFDELTHPRKKVLLRLLAGETDKEIAESLYIAEPTVRKHIETICKAFKCEPDERRSKRPDLISLFRKYKPELVKERTPPIASEVNVVETAREEHSSDTPNSQDCPSTPGSNFVGGEGGMTYPSNRSLPPRTSEPQQTPVVIWEITLNATLDDVEEEPLRAIVTLVKQHSKDVYLTLNKIEEGSVKLIFEGSEDGFKRIEALFKAGNLTHLEGILVKNVRIISNFLVPKEKGTDSESETESVQARINKTLEDKANLSQERLFGVEQYIATLKEYLQDKESSWFISVVGTGGVGKTSVVEKLVREHTVESGFIDLAWVTAKRTYFRLEDRSIRDIGTTLNIDALVYDIAEQLQINLPPTIDEHFPYLQSQLRSAPYLVVVDNLETLQDYTDLITRFDPYSQRSNLKPSKILFTSRAKIQRLTTQVREVELLGIGVNPTLDLIRYKGKHVQRINDALDEELLPIYRATNGIPILILLVVSLIATDDSPLDEIIQSLIQQNELYTYLYEEALSSISDKAYRVLTSMTDFSESIPVPRRQLKQQAELSDDEFREAVAECIQRSLLTSISKQLSDEPRYSIHNLLYEFLRSLESSD